MMQISLSIVSHGHSEAVRELLIDLNAYRGAYPLRLLLTLNVPELEPLTASDLSQVSRWPLMIISNSRVQGFAKNHNAAFKKAEPGIWCVVNPDIRLFAEQIDTLLNISLQSKAGLTYPKQSSPAGQVLDYYRELVTPWSLMKRYLGRVPERPMQPEWVSGCFMAFRSEVYQELGGFDEKYFLYCEDVDICLRLQLAGYKMVEADFSIVHDTRRGTLKNWDHFKWHVSSLLKLWSSRVFWVYLWNRHKIRQR
jgi:N-acetylglucosaminyl-diphospho-decaprenol L-rhamnosyltransferase